MREMAGTGQGAPHGVLLALRDRNGMAERIDLLIVCSPDRIFIRSAEQEEL